MKIAMIGTGYVGLVSGLCFSEIGHTVVCVDNNPSKIGSLNAGNVPIYEPGLKYMMATNTATGRLSFTGDMKQAVHDADAVFIGVGTPTKCGDGNADLTYVFTAAAEVAAYLAPDAVVAIKSTVPVGTNRKVSDLIQTVRPDLALNVASNPEFLREGTALLPGVTWIDDAYAAALMAIAEAFTQGKGVAGIYYYCGTPSVSWAEFAEAIFAGQPAAPHITGIRSNQYPTPAKHPLNSTLDCSKIFETYDIKQPDWCAGLRDVLDKLEAEM